MNPTCQFCGRRLRANYEWDPVTNTTDRNKVRCYGYTGSGFYYSGSPFCSLRCGFGYAVRQIEEWRAHDTD